MTLATHAAFGAALAQVMPNKPLVGFALGFASHFVLDAVPHWDYSLSSRVGDGRSLDTDLKLGKNFIVDLGKIALDVLLGLIIVFALPRGETGYGILLCGAIGGMLPDALQFAYFKLRWPILTLLQHFHVCLVHTNVKITNAAVGVGSQALLLGLLWWVMLILHT